MTAPTTQVVSVVLEATVDTHAWALTYGDPDPTHHLADHVAHDAAYAPRLLAITDDETADIRLVSHQVTTTGRWTRCQVTLHITADTARWQHTYGTDPVRGIGAHLAAELDTARPLRDELDGSILFHPESSTITTTRPTTANRSAPTETPR